MRTRTLIAVLTLCALAGTASADADLAGGFATPPDSAKPWVFMWWYDNITPADVTQHMEELKAKGVGGVLLFDHGGMPGVPYVSDKWRELFRHTVREADRRGLIVGVNGCANWPSGGPWITPEISSKMVVFSETVIQGPQKFSGKLVEPKSKRSPYVDVSVQAFPISDKKPSLQPVITVSSNPGDLPGMLDGHFMTGWHSGPHGQQWILVDFGGPHVVDWTWIDLEGSVSIEASSDGVAFRPVGTLRGSQFNTIYGAVPSTTARWFRVVVPNNTTVRDFSLGTRTEVDRFARLAAKRAITNPLGITATRQADQVRIAREDLVALPYDQPIRVRDMIDLTDKLSDGGTLNWDVPPGTWKVVRIGCTGTGIGVSGGLLPDYLSPAASELNYEKAMKPLVGDAGALAGKTFQFFHEDNVEIGGVYCWTPKLLDEFQRRRGYNPTPYLSAMAGEIVDNVEITDRFLADVRRTIADCVADGHYGRWAELAHADGMKVRAEAGGQHHPRLLCNDGLMNQGRMDVPVAEFWENEFWKENQWSPTDHHTVTRPGWDEAAQSVNAKQAASAAHLYGKRTVAAEAFTSLGPRAHWGVAPGDLLLYANIAFCEGINAMTIHGSATSGPDSGKPGKEFAAGTHFNHNITWWNQGAEQFLRYLARCQFLLQQGHFVADVLYYSGDEAPNFVPPKNIDPSRGFGYDYDVCNTEILLTRLSVKDGRIVLPDGMSYRLLVLPDQKSMPVEVLEKIKALVEAGATVVGPRPQRTPGLKNYPKCDEQIRVLAQQLWGDGDAKGVIQRQVGKGRIIQGKSLRDILQADGIGPDFSFQTAEKPQPLVKAQWIWHAADGDNPPAATRLFKSELEIPAGRKVQSARLWVTADNGFEFQVNGVTACRGNNWGKIEEADLRGLLREGKNTLQVSAVNADPSAAGLIAQVTITFDQGEPMIVTTGDNWVSSSNGDLWTPVHVVGGYGCEPWGSPGSYKALPLLDFIHRTVDGSEIYFVANRRASTLNADCAFRVSGKQPELWNPVTGEQRDLPRFESNNGRTSIPLEFEPYGSLFVVFRKGTQRTGRSVSTGLRQLRYEISVAR